MTKQEKEAICELWIAVFGTQEGCGYNCPQGAYDFYEVVRAHVIDECIQSINNIKTNKMASHNDITGDALVSKRNNDAYRDNYDKIFGQKTKEKKDDGDSGLDKAKDLPQQETP